MQTEGLLCAICYLGFLFQTPSGGVFAVPQQIAVLIGHFSWDADLVAVEVVGLLASFTFFVDPGCVPVPKVRSCRDRCRYRYICRPIWLLAVYGCRPKRSEYGFEVDWNCLKSRNRVRSAPPSQNWRFCVGYGLLLIWLLKAVWKPCVGFNALSIWRLSCFLFKLV